MHDEKTVTKEINAVNVFILFTTNIIREEKTLRLKEQNAAK
jgi:hypothetical protein